MYCERCNIDFPEGLRYCKWCGQGLIERRRATSELYNCPTCAATVQAAWAFCKGCGQPLTRKPASGSLGSETGTPSTAVMARCPAGGDPLDRESLYCKSCGSAVYSQPSETGSSLLCR